MIVTDKKSYYDGKQTVTEEEVDELVNSTINKLAEMKVTAEMAHTLVKIIDDRIDEHSQIIEVTKL